MKYQIFLRMYKACLQVYPAKFRQRYAEQMYLTAEDMLGDAPGLQGLTRMLQLAGDASLGLMRERAKQLGGAGMKKQSKLTWGSAGRAILLGVQIVWVPLVAAYFVVEPIMFTASGPRDQYATLPLSFAPLLMAILSFRVLRSLAGLALWSRIVRVSVMTALGGAVYFFVYGVAVERLFFYNHPSSVFYDYFFEVLFIASFYLVSRRFVNLQRAAALAGQPS